MNSSSEWVRGVLELLALCQVFVAVVSLSLSRFHNLPSSRLFFFFVPALHHTTRHTHAQPLLPFLALPLPPVTSPTKYSTDIFRLTTERAKGWITAACPRCIHRTSPHVSSMHSVLDPLLRTAHLCIFILAVEPVNDLP